MLSRQDNIFTEFGTRKIVILEESKEEAISLQEIKEYLKITHNNDDNRLKILIKSVRDFVEQYTKYSLLERKVKYIVDDFEIKKIGIIPKPLKDIERIIVYRINGEYEEVGKTQYQYDDFTNSIILRNSFRVPRLAIIFTCGFTKNEVPMSLKEAMLQHIAMIYDQNIEINNPPKNIKLLYSPFRSIRII